MAHATDRPKVGYVTVATVHDRHEARAIAEKLEAAAIECLLVDERGTIPLGLGKLGLGEIKVQVTRRDVSRALQVLRGQVDKSKLTVVDTGAPGPIQRIVDALTGWKLILLQAIALVAVAGLLAMLLYY
jgi:hypothetical protein